MSVVWTDEARARVHPRRSKDRARLTPPVLDRRELFARISTEFRKCSASWCPEPKLQKPKNIHLTEVACVTLVGPEPPAPPLKFEHESAAAVALVGTAEESSVADMERMIVDYWVATAGVGFAVGALVGTSQLEVSKPEKYYHILAGNPLTIRRWFNKSFRESWARLRRHLASCDDEAYGRALGEARKLREGAPPAVLCALAFAFPDEAEWGRAAAAARGAPYSPWDPLNVTRRYPWNAEDADHLWCLLSTVTDAALVRALIDFRIEMKAKKFQFAMSEHAGHVFTLVDTLGSAAAEPLELVLANLADDDKQRRVVADALALIRTPEAAAVMATLLAKPDLEPVARQYFRDAPHLAPMAAGEGRPAV